VGKPVKTGVFDNATAVEKRRRESPLILGLRDDFRTHVNESIQNRPE
jgi:hypothetical protein